jgi:hypothetical protein
MSADAIIKKNAPEKGVTPEQNEEELETSPSCYQYNNQNPKR